MKQSGKISILNDVPLSCSVGFLYAVILLIHTFLIVGRRNTKKRREELANDRWGLHKILKCNSPLATSPTYLQ
jgi:hypothetical protein